MQTQRLASLVTTAHIEQLLDSYVSGSGILPADAHKRPGCAGLPAELKYIAVHAIADGYVCSLWTDGARHWFFAGSLALDRAREIGRPVLEVHRFDDVRCARHTVLAARRPDGSWCHCTD